MTMRILGVLVTFTAGLGLAALLAGCGGGSQAGPVGPAAQDPEALRQNALALLREERPSITTYSSAVQQFNNYLDRKPEVADRFQLAPAVRELLEKELLKGLLPRGDAPETLPGRMKEVERKSFTMLDAYHLDACFLFRDAAQALRNDLGDPPVRTDPRFPEYQQRFARHAFEWVIRQIQLQPRTPGTDAWPAHEILRRGTGDGEERARVFLALVEQLAPPGPPDFLGCIVTRAVEVAK